MKDAQTVINIAEALAAGLCAEALPGAVIPLYCSLAAGHAPLPHRAGCDKTNKEVFVQWPIGYKGPLS